MSVQQIIWARLTRANHAAAVVPKEISPGKQNLDLTLFFGRQGILQKLPEGCKSELLDHLNKVVNRGLAPPARALIRDAEIIKFAALHGLELYTLVPASSIAEMDVGQAADILMCSIEAGFQKMVFITEMDVKILTLVDEITKRPQTSSKEEAAPKGHYVVRTGVVLLNNVPFCATGLDVTEDTAQTLIDVVFNQDRDHEKATFDRLTRLFKVTSARYNNDSENGRRYLNHRRL